MNSSTTVIRFRELADLQSVSEKIWEIGKEVTVWLFQGHMGAGKTTLIKALCQKLGVTSSVHSPTFSLVNEYISEDKRVLYHFDFYRIKDEVEALDIGVEEYFDSGSLCLVEWPSKIEGLWPLQYMLLDLHMDENGDRVLEVREIKAS